MSDASEIQIVGANITRVLAPLDPLDVLFQAAPIVFKAIHDDPNVKEGVQAGLEWISSSLNDPTLLSAFKTNSRPGAQPESTLISVMHLRVLESISTSKLGLKEIEDNLKDSSRFLTIMKEGIAKTDAHFISNLLTETEARASRSTDFANRLAIAEEDAKKGNEILKKMPSPEGPVIIPQLVVLTFHEWWQALIGVGVFILVFALLLVLLG